MSGAAVPSEPTRLSFAIDAPYEAVRTEIAYAVLRCESESADLMADEVIDALVALASAGPLSDDAGIRGWPETPAFRSGRE